MVLPPPSLSLLFPATTGHSANVRHEVSEQEPQQDKKKKNKFQVAGSSTTHLEVIRGVWVLVAGDDLGCHPVRRPNECVSSSYRSVQLGRDAEIHCRKEKRKKHHKQINFLLGAFCVKPPKHTSATSVMESKQK